MKLFNRLPGYVPAPPGLERKVLRAMPVALGAGVSLLLLPSVLVRLWSLPLNEEQLDELSGRIDIYTAGAILCYCNFIVAMTIGAIIIVLMKGPAFVADPYPLSDADRPADPRKARANGRNAARQ